MTRDGKVKAIWDAQTDTGWFLRADFEDSCVWMPKEQDSTDEELREAAVAELKWIGWSEEEINDVEIVIERD
jgi:hypothetical protein